MTAPTISNIDEAWVHFHQFFPGFYKVDRFLSQSQHGGPAGPTHIISINTFGNEREYLTRKRYWANARMCKVNDIMSLPQQDRIGDGETMKTRMLEMMIADLDMPHIKRVTHVTVMPDGKFYVFDARNIAEYVATHDSYCDHKFAGKSGAVFYPLRLAEEFIIRGI